MAKLLVLHLHVFCVHPWGSHTVPYSTTESEHPKEDGTSENIDNSKAKSGLHSPTATSTTYGTCCTYVCSKLYSQWSYLMPQEYTAVTEISQSESKHK